MTEKVNDAVALEYFQIKYSQEIEFLRQLKQYLTELRELQALVKKVEKQVLK